MTQSPPPSTDSAARSAASIGGGVFHMLAVAATATATAAVTAVFLAHHQIETAANLDRRILPNLVASQHLNSDIGALTNYALQFQNIATIAERATLQERIDSRNASIDRNLTQVRQGVAEETPALRRLTMARGDLNASVADMATLTDSTARNGEKLRLLTARLRGENAAGMEEARLAGLRELAALAAGAPSPLILRNIARQFEAALATAKEDNDIKRLKALVLGEEGIVALKHQLLDAQQQQRFLVRRQADLADQMTSAAAALRGDAEQVLNKARGAAITEVERLIWMLGGSATLAILTAFYSLYRLRYGVLARLNTLSVEVRPYVPEDLDAGKDELDRLTAGVHAMQALIKRQTDTLALPAQTDSLTGLADRRRFFELIADALADLRANGGEVVILLVDIDRFSKLNEAQGALAGDQALKNLAGLLRRRCRDHFTPARLGADDFAVLAPGVSLGEAEIFAMRLRQSANDLRLSHAEQDDAPLMLSIGLTALRPEDRTPEDALRRADEALRRAKQEGGDRVILASVG